MFLLMIPTLDTTLPQITKRIGNVGRGNVINAVYPETKWDIVTDPSLADDALTVSLRRYRDKDSEEAQVDYLYRIPYYIPDDTNQEARQYKESVYALTLTEFLSPAALPFSQIDNQMANLQKAEIVAHDISGAIAYPDSYGVSRMWKSLLIFTPLMSPTESVNVIEYSFFSGQTIDAMDLSVVIKWLSKLLDDENYFRSFLFTQYKNAIKRNSEEPFNNIDHSVLWMVFLGAVEYLGQIGGSLPVSEYNTILEHFIPLWVNDDDIKKLISCPADKQRERTLTKIHNKIYLDGLTNIKAIRKIFTSLEHKEQKELLDYLCSVYIYLSFRENPVIEYDEDKDAFTFYRRLLK